jgi:hypothetical protein
MNDNFKDDLSFIKNELESLNIKVDMVLDMLNNFTIMLAEAEDDDIYDTEDSWVPNDEDEDDEEDDNDWGNYQDNS